MKVRQPISLTTPIDFLITPLFAQPGAAGQIGWFAATQLQRHRMLLLAVAQVTRYIAGYQRSRRNHCRVQQRVARKQAMKIAAMPIRPVEHERTKKKSPGKISRGLVRCVKCLPSLYRPAGE